MGADASLNASFDASLDTSWEASSGPAPGRAASSPPGRVSFRSYTADDGLTNLVVTGFAEDGDGARWVSTDEGLFRLDGERFTRVGAAAGIASSHIHTMTVAPDGALCIGTPVELVCGRGSRFVRVHAQAVTRVVRSPDALWFMTARGLMVRRGGAVTAVPVPGAPAGALPLLWADKRGVIVGAGSSLWLSSDGATWTHLQLQLGSDGGDGNAASEPRELMRDASGGALWLRTSTRIWRVAAGETAGRDVTYQLPASLDLRFGQTMAFSPAGELTVGTSAGLGFFRGDHWAMLDGERGLPTNSAHLVFYDRGGELWVGSVGVHRRLGRGMIERHTVSTGLPGETVWAITRNAGGELLVGTSQCLVEVIGGRGAGRPVWSCVPGTQGRVVRSIAAAPDGGVYFGGVPAELYHRSAAGTVTRVADLGASGARQLLAVVLDGEGALWLGADNGLYWRAPGGGEVQPAAVPGGIAAHFVSAIVRDGPRLWFAGYEGVLVRERGEWTHLTKRNGLRATPTRYLARRHDGRICVLYNEGLGVTCFRYGGGELAELHHIDAAHGLEPLTAYSLGEDSAGRLWLGTGLGLRVIAREPSYGIDRFTTRDGIAGDDASAMAFRLDEDGGLWFGSSSGLTHVAASNYHGPIEPPGVRILSLALGARVLAGGPAAEIDGGRTLRGAFVADSPDAASVEYQARLLPEQQGWSPAPARQVRYAGLEPGSYQLEVQARVKGGAWGPVARVPFSIPLAWWQARWLWGLGAMLGVAMIGLLVLGWQRATMRRRTRALLAHTDASFRAFLASMPELVLVRRADGAVHFNEAARDLFGAAGERAGTWLLRCVHPADRPRAAALLRSAPVARRWPITSPPHGEAAEGARRGKSAAGEAALASGAGSAPLPSPGHELVELRVRAGEQWRDLEVSHQTVSLSGKPAHILVGRDVTERRRLQAKMLTADRMVSLGTLVAGIGHEINNPLSYVLGNLEVLAELVADSSAALNRDELSAAVHDALDGAGRVRTIVQRLSSFSRSSEEVRVAVVLDDVIEQAVRLTHNELRHRAQLVLATQSVPAVLADPGQLTQVMINLLVNAAHAISPGAADRHRITVRTRCEGEGQVILEVQDTGSGMDPQVAAHAFDPFFTTKRVGEGTGLGLSICHGIITNHGGQIAIESQRGEGTTMRIALPAHRPRKSAGVAAAVAARPAIAMANVPAGKAATAPAVAPVTAPAVAPVAAPVIAVKPEVSRPHQPAAGAGARVAASGAPDAVRAVGSTGHARPRVLVIDDEPAVGKVLARMLRSECDVVVLTDGEDALRRVSHGERFGAIITDVMMPVLTGLELREQLHAIDPDQARRIVFITGGVFNAATAELLEQPDIRCMTKPVDADALRRAVSEVTATMPLGRGEAEAAAPVSTAG